MKYTGLLLLKFNALYKNFKLSAPLDYLPNLLHLAMQKTIPACPTVEDVKFIYQITR